MDLTVWFGPVSVAQVAGAVLPGSTLRVVQVARNADAQPYLNRWRGADGAYIPGMLRDMGVDPSQLGSLVIGSFSAGHNLAKPITKAASDRAAIRALMLSDSSQSAWSDAAHTLGSVPAGYEAFAAECAATASQLFVATAGTGTDSTYASSSATLRAIVQDLQAAGTTFADQSPLVPSDLAPPPVSIQAAGDFLVLDYQSTISHEDHVLKLAPVVWQSILAPWFAQLPVGPTYGLVPPYGRPPGAAPGSGTQLPVLTPPSKDDGSTAQASIGGSSDSSGLVIGALVALAAGAVLLSKGSPSKS